MKNSPKCLDNTFAVHIDIHVEKVMETCDEVEGAVECRKRNIKLKLNSIKELN